MLYFVAEQENTEHNHKTITSFKDINQEEVEDILSHFSFSIAFHTATTMKDIVMEDGVGIQRFINDMKTKPVPSIEGCKKLLTTANSMILHYATAIRAFIDITETYLRKNASKADFDQFHGLQSKFFNDSMEYRFWSNLRNYVVHCGFLYNGYHVTHASGLTFICSRDNLLLFHNWKHSKDDIQNMPENILLETFVTPMSGFIYALYIDFITLFGDLIISAIAKYGEFCKKYDVHNPIIICSENEEEMKKGKMFADIFPITDLNEAFDVLKSNPNVRLKYE